MAHTLTPEVKKLRTFAKKFGANICVMADGPYMELAEDDAFSGTPFTSYDLGVQYDKKLVLVHEDALEDLEWSAVVHELGHILACKKEPNKLEDEWDFFGWEIALVEHLGLDFETWVEDNKLYTVPNPEYVPWVATNQISHQPKNVELGSLTRPQQEKIFEEALARSREVGLVSRRGEPLSIRH